MSETLFRRIEEASLNAWPAPQQIIYDGWLLRLAGGYTRRANSVNPLYASSLPLDEKLAFCREFYAARHLPLVVRMTEHMEPGLDDRLAALGYTKSAETLVMVCELATIAATGADHLMVIDDLDEWMHVFHPLSGTLPGTTDSHLAILRAITGRAFPVLLTGDNGGPVTAGMGVLEGRLFGLFDIVTIRAERGKGYGTRLVAGLLDIARQQGAQHAYLQVMTNNNAALHVYHKLGFTDAYRYWYRNPPEQG
jgi:ribosomal protein S18 acetylase RimI-like enzyme